MKTVRRFAVAAFAVACLHLVFGAIVRISGSGMGCGPHWPKCYGYWFPPMSRPDLVIEVLHRYLASVLLLSLIALVVAAFRRRDEPGVGGRGGVLRPAVTALCLGFGAALLGAVTVKLANAPLATLAHWTVAMSLVAAVTATVIRTGGLGGASALAGGASRKARRGTFAAAALALAAVVMGGLTAKTQGGPVACQTFLPFCTPNPDVARAAVHVQVTHRWIAVLLVLHLAGLFFAFRKRGEPSVIRRAATIALSFGVLQLLVAGAMIGMHLPPVLRSLHEATGVSIWIAAFALAYLTRIASEATPSPAVDVRPPAPVPSTVPEMGATRAARSPDVTVAPVEARVADEPVALREQPREPGPAGTATAQVAAHATLLAARAEVAAAMAEEPDTPALAREPFEDLDASILGRDPFDDADDIEDELSEEVPSLDEEFSRLAMEAEEATDLEAEAIVEELTDFEREEVAEDATEPEPVKVPESATVAVAAPAPAVVAGKSTMHHSVAVIISRGADF